MRRLLIAVFLVSASGCSDGPPVFAPDPLTPLPTVVNSSGSGNLNAMNNGCGLSASAPITYTLNVDSKGDGSYIKVHTVAGVRFSFIVHVNMTSTTTAQFTATTTQTINGQPFQVTDVVDITNTPTGPKSLAITQNFLREGASPCNTTYNGTATGQ